MEDGGDPWSQEGILDLVVQVSNDVDNWCDRMEQDGTCVDHNLMDIIAKILDSDIVVVSPHGNDMGHGHIIRWNTISPGQARQEFPNLHYI